MPSEQSKLDIDPAPDYSLDDIKVSGEKPRMGIELDDRSYEVEVDLTMKQSTKYAKTRAWYRENGEVYEVKNWSKLKALHDLFMKKYRGRSDD